MFTQGYVLPGIFSLLGFSHLDLNYGLIKMSPALLSKLKKKE